MSRMEDLYAALMRAEGRSGRAPATKPTGRPRTEEDAYRDMAQRGLTTSEAAYERGVSRSAVSQAADRYGIRFRDGRVK